MKNINRENYEIWFIDFIDGKLDDEALKELNTFLHDNPDLKEELCDFEEFTLKPSDVSCNRAEQLFKSESDLMDISRCDYLMIKQMEEGLSEEEKTELALVIGEEEFLIGLGAEYQHCRLVPEFIRYDRKSSLLQKRTYPIRLYAGRIAAVVVAIVLLLTPWDSFVFRVPENNNLAMQPMQSLPAVVDFSTPPEINLVKIDLTDNAVNPSINQSDFNIVSNEVIDGDKFDPYISSPEEPLEKLQPGAIRIEMAGVLPNAYEEGLRHMMPIYLDINRYNERMLASAEPRNVKSDGRTFLIKGLQFVDRVSGDLVNFDKMYDEDGNFVAYNLKAGYFEVERKLRR